VGDLGLTFSRISHAVRQSIALEARIDADQLAWATKRNAEQAEVAARRWEAREDKVERVVEQIIEAEASDAARASAPFSRREKEGPSEAGRMRDYADSGPGP
jgi:hypothetical protein